MKANKMNDVIKKTTTKTNKNASVAKTQNTLPHSNKTKKPSTVKKTFRVTNTEDEIFLKYSKNQKILINQENQRDDLLIQKLKAQEQALHEANIKVTNDVLKQEIVKNTKQLTKVIRLMKSTTNVTAHKVLHKQEMVGLSEISYPVKCSCNEGDTSSMHNEKINGIFSSVYRRYDFLNHFFSCGLDFWWRHKLVNAITLGPNAKILDMAAGTLDVSIAMHKKYPHANIVAGDICKKMLAFGKQKLRKVAQKEKKMNAEQSKSQLSFFVLPFCRSIASKISSLIYGEPDCVEIKANNAQNSCMHAGTQVKTYVIDVQEIPLKTGLFDVCTIAFGIRNVENRLKAIKEMHRVLAIGGQLYILEFAPVNTPIFGTIYHFYLEHIMPQVAKLFIKDASSYFYFAKTIKDFPDSEAFTSMIKEAGFSYVKYEKLSLGMVTLYTAIKSR